ncbi:MAG TPA: fused MFS/spermidine synthase [Pseudonocardiaceae bacterium]|nr:fused MFS/spermidine synthase [Pseudonocardiaceae bacterium]
MPDKRPARAPRRRSGSPTPGRYPVRFGTAELLADADRPGGWLLTVDGVPQSYVDLDDPKHLDFEYVQRMAELVDAIEPAGGALHAVHIGGGGCTLPRYLAATRPGSRQLVIEADGPLADLVREQLELRSVANLRVRVGDGYAEIGTLRPDSADLLVVDAFERAVMPGGLGTPEFVAQAGRVLRDSGMYLLNVAADPTGTISRRIVAGVLAGFPHRLLVAEPGVLRGRRPGNLVVAASRAPLPVDVVAGRIARAAFPVRLLTGADLDRYVSFALTSD